MRKVSILFFFLFAVLTASAQEESKNDTIESPWKTGARTNLSFSQVSLTNWASGGENSISGNFNGHIFANYINKNSKWENALDVAYGLMKQGEDAWIKTDDRLELVSKYGRKAFMNNENWYYSAMFSLKTQLDEGYDYPNDSVMISKFMAPGYLMFAMGLDYNPNDNFSMSYSPVTGKTTIVNDQKLAGKGAFGVDAGEKIRYEFGGFAKFMYNKEIWKNVEMATKLGLFSNYFNNPLNIDINWDFTLNMKVNEYLSASVNTTLLYDDDVDIKVDSNNDGNIDSEGPRIQFKEVLGIGLRFKF